MDMVFIQMAECCLRVSLVTLAALGCVALVDRQSPAVRAFISAVGLLSILLLTALVAVPLPSWWSWDFRSSTSSSDLTAMQKREAAVEKGMDTQEAQSVRVPESASGGMQFDLRAAAQRLRAGQWSAAERQFVHCQAFALILLAGSAAFGVLRLLWSLATALRIGRQSHPVFEPSVPVILAETVQRLNCSIPVLLRESAELHSAATIGWLHPLIVLPIQWREWSEEELRGVLAHELAHVVRRDFATRCAALLASAMHFYNPLVHCLTRRVVLNQELAADALAARATGGQGSYLRALSRIALREDDWSRSRSVAGLLPVSSGLLIRRIEMLQTMKCTQRAGSRQWAGWTASSLLVILAVAVAGVRGAAAPPSAGGATAGTETRGDSSSEVQSPDSGVAFGRSPIDPSPVALPGVPPEQAFAQGAFAIRVADLLKRPEIAPMLPEIDRGLPELWMQVFEAPSAPEIALADIEYIVGNLHLTFTPVGGVPTSPRFAFVSSVLNIRFRKPLDWQQLAQCLPNATRERHSGVSYLKLPVLPALGSVQLCLFQADDRTVVVAFSEDIARHIIERPAAEASPAWMAHWNAADGGLVTVLAPSPAAAYFAVAESDLDGWFVPGVEVVQPQELHMKVTDPMVDPLSSKFIAILDKSSCIAGGIDWADGSDIMEVKLHLACGMETAPQEARDVLEKVIAPMRAAALNRSNVPVDSHLMQFLTSLSITDSGDAAEGARGVDILAIAHLPIESLLFDAGDAPPARPPVQ